MADINQPTSGDNSAGIKSIIRSAADRILRLQEEIGELRAQITEVRSEVKGAGIKMADFNAALRLYRMEIENRNESLDNIRMCFDALGLGGQGELFPAGKQPKPANESANTPFA